MKKRYSHLFFLFSTFCYCALTFSQVDKYSIKFENIGIRNGLSYSIVSGIAEDKKGFIWLGTQQGLNRYDGYEFKTYTTGPGRNFLSKQWISRIYKDKYEQLWIRFKGGGIDRLDIQNECFYKYKVDSLINGSLSNDEFDYNSNTQSNDFFEDSEDNLWIATNKGINKYNRKTDKFTVLNVTDSKVNGSLSNTVTFITEDKFKNLWIGTRNGLNKYNLVTRKLVHFNVYQSKMYKLNDSVITYINIHSDNTIWIGTLHGGINIIHNPQSSKYQYITQHIEKSVNKNVENTIFAIFEVNATTTLVSSLNGLNVFTKKGTNYKADLLPNTGNSDIYHILEDRGYFWLGSMWDGLMRLSPDFKTLESFRFETNNQFGIKGNTVQSLFKSKMGIIWIGVEKNGIYKLDMFSKNFQFISDNKLNQWNIPDKEVYSIYEDDNKKLWVGTKSGVSCIELDKHNCKQLKSKLNLKNSTDYEYSNILPAKIIGVITPAKDKKLWFGAFDNKISLYDPIKKIFLNFHNNENNSKSFRIWSLRSICVTHDNHTYFGGTNGGLCKLDDGGLTFSYFPLSKENKNGVSDKWINRIYEDSKGILWIGTFQRGIDRFDPKSGIFTNIQSIPGKTNTLPDNYISCIIEPAIYHKQCLWIGTASGLCSYDRNSGQIKTFNLHNGVKNNFIHGILEDNKGFLWLSTNKGLIKFDPLTESIRIYTEEDGLQSNEFNEGAYFKNKDGILYFGSENGIIFFDPNLISDNPNRAKAVITKFKLFNKTVKSYDYIDNRIILYDDISYTRKITLSNADKVFSFEFAGLHYIAPGKIKYRYMLSGFDNDWIEVNALQRFANYTNIPQGNYIFKVTCTNSDGIWSDEIAEINIHILPPFYRTWWFRTLLVVALIGFIISVIRIRTEILHKQKEDLRIKVEKRTAELKIVNEQLEQNQAKIIDQSNKIAIHRDTLKNQNTILEQQKDEIAKMASIVHEADMLKINFFTNISHEFRTPLTLIMGPTEKLLRQNEYSDTIKVKDNLSLIQRNIKYLYRLINQLLELRKIETGTQKIQIKPGDFILFLNEIYQLFLPLAESKGIDFKFVKHKASLWVMMDTDKLEKVFYNLLSNAFKNTPIGKDVSLIICETYYNGKDMLKVVVDDTGYGIAEADQPHIFERFYQSEVKNSPGQLSTGIGLSMSKDLIELHNGVIQFVSQPNKGTCFTVYLPLIVSDKTDNKSISEDSYSFEYLKSMLEVPVIKDKVPSISIIDNEESVSILLVEDNIDLQQFIYNELNNFKVWTASNGREGFEIAKEHLPDIIISDIMMPVMDGIELCSKIKEYPDTAHIPVFLLTAKTNFENQREGLEAGADDYITKPFSIEVLRLKITKLLNSRKALAEKFSKDQNIIPSNLKISQIDEGFLEKFVKTVEDNIDDTELSGDFLAEALNISKGNLYKKLKSLTGMTVNIYIRTIRLKVAAKILKSGHYNISEIAYSVGFSNPKYFSTCFSELFSKSPTEFMNE